MVVDSQHLTRIQQQQNRTTVCQVVFADVEKYSMRRTLTQTTVIDAFSECLATALENTSKEYTSYAQKRDVNFSTDIIKIPTGDGAAIVFSFDGLHDVHLFFARNLLELIHTRNASQPCAKFDEQGWCNCHESFNLAIGVSEGKAIVFEDINGRYNIAGSTVNIAARVMGLADSNQILFSEDAYKQIIDMVDDPYLVDHFVEFRDATVKHETKLNVFQYVDSGADYINSNPPQELALKAKAVEAMRKLSKLGFPVPPMDDPAFDHKQKAAFVDGLSALVENVAKVLSPALPKLPANTSDLANDVDDT